VGHPPFDHEQMAKTHGESHHPGPTWDVLFPYLASQVGWHLNIYIYVFVYHILSPIYTNQEPRSAVKELWSISLGVLDILATHAQSWNQHAVVL
jgi:hypothetical protein